MPAAKLINSPTPVSKTADRINRLHAESLRAAVASRAQLERGLIAAWTAGRLLAQEKQSVRRRMGAGAWGPWLEQNFAGTARTAQRYMKLARLIPDSGSLRGLSLRQIYFRLNIATEPKTPAAAVALPPLPEHVSLSMRLLGALRQSAGRASDATTRADLRPLYDHLREVFEA